jgi:hypothetical protein
MTYLNCPRCNLAIRVRADYLAPRNCPRCIARHHVPVPMYSAPQPARLATGGLLGPAPEGEPAGESAPAAAPMSAAR